MLNGARFPPSTVDGARQPPSQKAWWSFLTLSKIESFMLLQRSDSSPRRLTGASEGWGMEYRFHYHGQYSDHCKGPFPLMH